MLKGRVAVVTGSGRGIGMEIAKLLASYGAKVVVNDPGVDEKGEGAEKRIADQVVDQIKEAGGIAVANYDSVSTMEGAKNIIDTAVNNFGQIDILVNNAGIVRDRMIFNMSEQEWDAVLDVHLKGSFATIRAVTPIMRQQGCGRIINLTSTTGIIGNRGQANYGAAKAGIAGLSKCVALDMAKYNVTVNSIAPFAWTRMTGTISNDDPAQARRVELLKKMSPAKIAPLVAFLASEAAGDVTGQIFGVRANEIFLFSQIRPIRSMHNDSGWTVEKISEIFIPSVRKDFYSLDTSVDVFPYDPLG